MLPHPGLTEKCEKVVLLSELARGVKESSVLAFLLLPPAPVFHQNLPRSLRAKELKKLVSWDSKENRVARSMTPSADRR